jgi:hypothetical protein
MGRKTKILGMAVAIAAVLAMVIGGAAMAAGPVNTANGVSNNYGLGARFGGQGVCPESVTELLGLTAEEIQAMRQEGLSLVEIAALQNVTEAQLMETIMAEKQLQIQERVTAGTLTEEQAALMLQNMEQNVLRAINRTTVGQPEWAGGQGNGQMKKQGQSVAGTVNNGICSGTGTGNMHRGNSR